MPSPTNSFTIGVEEEYQVIDPETRGLCLRSQHLLPHAQEILNEDVQPELYLSQIETASPVCNTLAEARAQITRMRQGVIEAANKQGTRIAAAGTHPFSHWQEQQVTPKDRYRGIAAEYQQLARELIIFGCHVHVGLEDREVAVQVMNRMRNWLAPILALTANSPFWLGEDSGYASFRTELWSPFPMAGPPQLFASRAEHDALVNALVQTGSIEDGTKIYWDVRLPERVQTVEFRVTDVCMTIDETVMVAGLARSLVQACLHQAMEDVPYVAARPELVRAAHWRAARHGLGADLIDVEAERAIPAADMLDRLLDFVRPPLQDSGDWDEVSALVQHTRRNGTGADRQREVFKETGKLEAVVDYLVTETARGTHSTPN